MNNLSYEEVYQVTLTVIKDLMNNFIKFKYTKKNIPNITPQSNLKEDLGIDSMDRIDILLLMEDVYKVELLNEESAEEKKDLYGTKTVEEFTWYAHKKLNGGYGELRSY